MAVEITSLRTLNMGHLNKIETTLRELIARNDVEALVSWVKERVLESYKNGLSRVERKATSRNRTSSDISK